MPPPNSHRIRSRIARAARERRALLACVGIGLVICAVLAVAGPYGVFAYAHLRAENERVLDDIRVLKEDTAALEDTRAHLEGDDDYIAHIAREDLGMVAPDEILYQEARR